MKQAFTLIELSIVLVILGLITGGILTGKSLIRNSELRSVISQIQGYSTAVQNFKTQYNGLPGDLKNATDFWGAATCPRTATTTLTTNPITCNGDGDYLLEHRGNNPNSDEIFSFWQHLGNADLIEGKYTGVITTTGANSSYLANVNVPTSRIKNSVYFIRMANVIAPGGGVWFAGTYSTRMSFMSTTSAGIITPAEGWKIDSKLDDGFPATGKVGGALVCAPTGTADTAINAAYDLDNTDPVCHLVFQPGW